MSLTGIFTISCIEGNLSLFVPADAGPDFPDSPLQCVLPDSEPPTFFRVNSRGADNYEIVSVKYPNIAICAIGDASPKLLRMMSKYQGGDNVYNQWEIGQVDSHEYVIHAFGGSGDDYWTLNEGPSRTIKLQELKGERSQTWRLLRVQEEE
ncbi:hypothetical protein RSOLAG1IB_10274 [Rhizoctonia solani AG-1 IB]|uniref:Ricin B lectin domain-containing protein n=1 Tax=Thanatephorus cucumeris (strain AG1-IB / isolate 7/3/14) TaxID=1108050 RepID=M5C0H6_THACB|nr:hypothetical protein BN14_07033 [Rhizoctonia solani AG-1 IB]CEL62192.1 hypothetical protein RSOLAG1IB_10274 [Rhizoctonia solani AG-1 IB]